MTTMNTMVMYRQKDPLNLNPNLADAIVVDIDVAREALNLNLADATIVVAVMVKDLILKPSEFCFIDFDFGKLITPEIFL